MAEKIVLQKLQNIEKALQDIRERMIDADSVMTEEDYRTLLEYRKEKKYGKLISHDKLKQAFGV